MSAGEMLYLLSANDDTSLRERANQVAEFVERTDPPRLDLAATLERGRAAMKYRGALLVPEGDDVAAAFRELDAANYANGIARSGTPSVAWLFPGQGAQFRGMARQLFEKNEVFRESFEQCARVLDPRLEFTLRELIFDHDAPDSTGEPLTQTQYTQPSLFVVEYCVAKVLEHFGVEPEALLGHSLGELTAACVAGVFELEAGLVLAHERGRLMQSMPPGSMLAVKASRVEVEPLMTPGLDLAAVNAPSMVVVSGPHEVVDAFEGKVSQEHACTRLKTSHAFHSAMMDPVVDRFVELVRDAAPKPPRIPIVSSLTGEWMSDQEATSPEYWARQLRHAVNFSGAAAHLLDWAKDSGRDLALVEVGPGTTLLSAASQQKESPRPRASVETLGHPKHARPAAEALLLTAGRLWIAGGGARLEAHLRWGFRSASSASSTSLHEAALLG